MKRRKDKKTFAKLGLLFTVLLILLASISMSHSAWTDTITIYGTINTGKWGETAWARMHDDPNDFTYEFSPGSNWATYIIYNETQEQDTFYLYAGQHHRAGELHIWKEWKDNNDYLCVKYILDDDMSASHLHIATSIDGISQNGNQPPGQFDYGEIHDPHVTEYTYNILWNQSWNNQDLFIAAHAVV